MSADAAGKSACATMDSILSDIGRFRLPTNFSQRFLPVAARFFRMSQTQTGF
jgi:hypothetical protein